MRDRFIITFSDYRGSRQFSLSGVARRSLLGVLTALPLIALCSVFFIYFLSGKVTDLNGQLHALTLLKEEMRHEREALMEEKIRLSMSVAHNIDLLGEELNHIETLIGLRPDPELPIIERIDTATQTALEKRIMLNSVPSGFPVDSRVITSPYGTRIHPVHGTRLFHGGVDLRSARGDPIYATADGVVEWAAMHRESGMGNMIILVHNFGFTTTYGHLHKIKVRAGEFVSKGDLIGLVGSTGVSTAPHLHYEIRYLKRRLNPRPFMDWSMEDYDVVFKKEDNIKWHSLAEAVRKSVSMPQRQSSPERLTSSARYR